MTSAIARMNLFLHGIEDFSVARGDTLADPKFLESDHLARFDVVLANPPYSIKQWNRAAWTSDAYGRNILGVPPQGRADYAFLQHILTSLATKTGRCAILFPHGVLFRDEERIMRGKLVDMDLIECVIGLGPNLFYNSPMEACVVVCRTRKSPERRGKILFINAVEEVTRERAQTFLEDGHIAKIVDAYEGFEDVPGFARIGTLEEIRANDSNLNIVFYVRPRSIGGSNGNVRPSLDELLLEWQHSSAELRSSMDELLESLAEIRHG